MNNTFESIWEDICCNCANLSVDCHVHCPFDGDFYELEKLCEKVDELAQNIARQAERNVYLERALDRYM